QAHGGFVAGPLHERIARNHGPRYYTRQQALRFLERVEMLRQKPAAQPILARQRAVGESVLNRKLRDLLIDPVPARAAEFELEDEIQRYAFLQRFLEGRIESNVELSVENVAILFEQKLS